ncbi:MFS general substrate transporter [Aspergillus steynii IBT 23096]|uniref:MFS general substrate transporter n=1 Tax=Aspergillus steynii IBT 23096 TaxID=1392250 RepID=A0A2I2G6K2_9EURO|nr:MFS general substrate transporter [Aspergillus steynii IBT 23096]PLB48493.1 MFS general substrate transporter [Aspergillus steynii IBT 23096]
MTSATAHDADEDRYPEGGLQSWSVVFGAWCAIIPSAGILNSLGVLQAWTSTHQLSDYSASSIGWIYGAFSFFLFSGGMYFGTILDSHGPLLILLPGTIGAVASLIFLSLSQEYYQIFLAFSVLGGLSFSTLLVPPVAAVGHWFNERRGFATGIVFTGGGLGGVSFPLIVLFVAPQIGFAWSIRVIALITAILCAVSCLTIKTRLPPKKTDSFFDLKALRDIKYSSTSAAIFLVELAAAVPSTYIASYALHAGIDEKLSYAMVVFLNAGAIFGRFLPGFIADKWGRFNVMVVTCVMCAVFTLTLWLCANGLAMIISYAVLFGFWSGAAISIPPVCVSQICEIQDYGKRTGTTWAIVSIGSLIGLPIAGAIIESYNGEYTGLIIYAGMLYVASGVAFLISRGICAGWSVKTIF